MCSCWRFNDEPFRLASVAITRCFHWNPFQNTLFDDRVLALKAQNDGFLRVSTSYFGNDGMVIYRKVTLQKQVIKSFAIQDSAKLVQY
jgi:hypothetical protein